MARRALPIIYGTLFVILYCFTTAGSVVLVDELEHSLAPMTVAFYAFLFTLTLFSLVSLRNIKDLINKVKGSLALVIKINISTAYMWIATFYAVKDISPSLFLSLFMGMAPITVLLVTFATPRSKKERYFDVGAAFVLLITIFALVVDELFYLKQFAHAPFAIFLALTSGTVGGLSILYSRQLSEHKFEAGQVLAIRFYLVLLAAFLFLIFNQGGFGVPSNFIVYVIGVAGISVALPLYLLQKGLEKIEALHVSFLTPLIPVLAYFLELLEPYYKFIWIEFILICLLASVILVSAIVKGRFARTHPQISE